VLDTLHNHWRGGVTAAACSSLNTPTRFCCTSGRDARLLAGSRGAMKVLSVGGC
jgi:hypothetical protein